MIPGTTTSLEEKSERLRREVLLVPQPLAGDLTRDAKLLLTGPHTRFVVTTTWSDDPLAVYEDYRVALCRTQASGSAWRNSHVGTDHAGGLCRMRTEVSSQPASSSDEQLPAGGRQSPAADHWSARQSGAERGSASRGGHGHPTPVAPLADLIGRTRFVVLLAVVSVILLSIALFAVGAAIAMQGTWRAVVSISSGDLEGTALSVEMLEIVTVILKAVVFYLIGVGLYSLFIAPLNLTTALGLSSLNDLEIKIVSVVVVILAVTYLEHFIRWQEPVEVLLYGFSLAIVVAALVFFQMHSHRSSRADQDRDATARVAAQREMFHQDHEQREVRPDEA